MSHAIPEWKKVSSPWVEEDVIPLKRSTKKPITPTIAPTDTKLTKATQKTVSSQAPKGAGSWKKSSETISASSSSTASNTSFSLLTKPSTPMTLEEKELANKRKEERLKDVQEFLSKIEPILENLFRNALEIELSANSSTSTTTSGSSSPKPLVCSSNVKIDPERDPRRRSSVSSSNSQVPTTSSDTFQIASPPPLPPLAPTISPTKLRQVAYSSLTGQIPSALYSSPNMALSIPQLHPPLLQVPGGGNRWFSQNMPPVIKSDYPFELGREEEDSTDISREPLDHIAKERRKMLERTRMYDSRERYLKGKTKEFTWRSSSPRRGRDRRGSRSRSRSPNRRQDRGNSRERRDTIRHSNDRGRDQERDRERDKGYRDQERDRVKIKEEAKGNDTEKDKERKYCQEEGGEVKDKDKEKISRGRSRSRSPGRSDWLPKNFSRRGGYRRR